MESARDELAEVSDFEHVPIEILLTGLFIELEWYPS